jgi:hypothetical protein
MLGLSRETGADARYRLLVQTTLQIARAKSGGFSPLSRNCSDLPARQAIHLQPRRICMSSFSDV